jgi:hypothetical protein
MWRPPPGLVPVVMPVDDEPNPWYFGLAPRKQSATVRKKRSIVYG